MSRIQSHSGQLAFYNLRLPGDENVMMGADLGMRGGSVSLLSSSAKYWCTVTGLLPHHREMSEGPRPDRSVK